MILKRAKIALCVVSFGFLSLLGCGTQKAALESTILETVLETNATQEGVKEYSQEELKEAVRNGNLPEGSYQFRATLTGGSGKASIKSPVKLEAFSEKYLLEVEFSSANYDYVIWQEEKYFPVNTEGNSVFELPMDTLTESLSIVADTTAMSKAHEIEYEICLELDSIEPYGNSGQDGTDNDTDTLDADISDTDGASTDTKAEILVKKDGEKKYWDNRNISAKLSYVTTQQLDYATHFQIDEYEDGFYLLTIADESRFLINTQQKEIPDDLSEDIVVLSRRPEKIYLVASAVMDMFCQMDGLDHIALSGTKADGWYIEEARQAMEAGTIVYAGKYSAPDYELILASGCDFVIESTMILHSPDVKEALERLKIPVLVDYSSYEAHPLGRAEWIKVYGLLTGNEKKAQEAFDRQKEQLEKVVENVAAEKEQGEKTKVAFFYITTNGSVVVRKGNDAIANVIGYAGGEYAFADWQGDSDASSGVNLQMEEFVAQAKDADVLIYNSTIDGNIYSIEDLIAKDSLLAEFKAVKEKNVFCTTQNLYQKSMEIGDLTKEIYEVLSTKEAEDDFQFIYKLQ